MKKLIFLASFIFFLFLPPVAFAKQKVQLWFFWGQGCPHCAAEKPFLEELAKKYPQLEIKEFEVYYNKENQQLFEKVAKAYNTSAGGVPMTFVGKDFVSGFLTRETTGKKIEQLVRNCLLKSCPSPQEVIAAGGVENCRIKESEICFPFFGKELKFSSNSPLFVLGAILGLADGINPCMFSVLLFLLTYLLAIGSKKRAVKVGLVFVVGVFVIYFLFMAGMLNLITLIGVIQKIKIVVAILALLAGVVMIKDFFAYGKWFSLEIPESTKPAVEKLIKKGTIPSAILLAGLSSLVELPCTAGIPLVYTTLLAQRQVNHFAYLFWYNLFFVIPLLLIIAGVAFAWAQADKLEKWRLNFRKYMRLAAGAILVFLAIALFRGWM